MTPKAQLRLLLELPPKGSRLAMSEDPLAEQIRQLMSGFLRQFGPPVPAREIAVVCKSGCHLWMGFVWPRGQPGFWQPAPRKKEDPWQTVRRWLGDWAN